MKSLQRTLSMQGKMLAVLIFGLLGFCAYFSVNYVILKNYRESMEKVVGQQLPALEFSNELISAIGSLRSSAIQSVLTQNFDQIGQVDKYHQQVVDAFTRWEQREMIYVNQVKSLHKDYDENYENLNETLQNVVAGVSSLDKVRGRYQVSISKLVELESNLGQLKGTINFELNSAVKSVDTAGQTAMGVGITLLLCALIATIVFFVILSNINKSLLSTNGTLQMTSRRLLEMVDEAQVSSNQLRETANRQSSSSTETVVSMEEMKRLLSQTSLTSVGAVRLSEASFQEANDGRELVQTLKDAMTKIERSNSELEEVNQVVRLIRERTTVINEIVFKTQMLSFNANIEAARAGQHGLGFAVVATEMGSLAEMSGKAAQQINELLDKSASKVENTIQNTKIRIGKANELSAKCYDFFKLLTDRSGQLKEMVDSISSAAAEQNSGVDYVVNAMNDLNNTAAESDRMAQGIAMLADGLKSHAVSLASAVDNLNGMISGGVRQSSSVELGRIFNSRRKNNREQSSVKTFKESA